MGIAFGLSTTSSALTSASLRRESLSPGLDELRRCRTARGPDAASVHLDHRGGMDQISWIGDHAFVGCTVAKLSSARNPRAQATSQEERFLQTYHLRHQGLSLDALTIKLLGRACGTTSKKKDSYARHLTSFLQLIQELPEMDSAAIFGRFALPWNG
jgi:hypothetical protein